MGRWAKAGNEVGVAIMAATDARDVDHGDSLGHLLAAWQSSGDPDRLATLLTVARPIIERTARRMLLRRHVADPAAIDDVVSQVFDHLRRLPGGSTGERLVASFTTRPQAEDDGCGYVVWLTSRRTMDVVRDRCRCHRQAHCFTEIAAADLAGLAIAHPAATEASPAEDICCRLHAAIATLEPRQRLVVELLLAGKSQAVIAHVLGVCEGTVSRLRSRAIESLRRMLDE